MVVGGPGVVLGCHIVVLNRLGVELGCTSTVVSSEH